MADCWPWEKDLGRYGPEVDTDKPRPPVPARELVGLSCDE